MRYFLLVIFILLPIVTYAQDDEPKDDKTKDTKKNDEEQKEEKKVFLTLGGDFQNAVNVTNDSKSTSVTNGTVGVKVVKTKKVEKPHHAYGKFVNEWESFLSITVASVSDTVKENYGSSILIPRKGVTSLTFQFTYYEILNPIFGNSNGITNFLKFIDLNSYFNVSNALWKTSDSTVTKATNFAAGILLSYDFSKYANLKDEKNTDITCSLGLGLCARSLVGDLSFKENDSLRTQLLGTEENVFGGLELKGEIGYKNLIISASYIYLFGKNEVRGLSRGNLLSSFNFGADIRL